MSPEITETVLKNKKKGFDVNLKGNGTKITFFCNSLKQAYELAEILKNIPYKIEIRQDLVYSRP